VRVNIGPHGLTAFQRLCREALVWRGLEHPFILPFIGIDAETFRSSNNVGLVAPWRDRGTLRVYMQSELYRPNVDSYRLVGIVSLVT
jgi:hypothetical protein